MQINIGKNIRELRRRDGRTQEDLANALLFLGWQKHGLQGDFKENAGDFQNDVILKLVMELSGAVSNSVLTRQSVKSSEYGREVLLAIIHMFETIFPDNRCGRQHFELRYLYF